MKAVLTLTAGPYRDRQWTIEPDRRLTIGRGHEADLVILDPEISRVHCDISCENGEWHIRDRESLNGTIVNGAKRGDSRVRHGDEIHIGATVMRFDVVGAPAPEPGGAPSELLTEPEKVTCKTCGRELPAGVTACPVCDAAGAPVATAMAAPMAPAPPAPPARPAVAAPAPAAPPGVQLAPPKIVRIEAENTIQEFIDQHPRDTSNIVLALRQKIWYLVIFLALGFLLVRDYLYFLQLVHVLCTFYLVVIGYKLITILLSVIWRWEIRVTPEEVASLARSDLPAYTILVPLYKESAVADKIVRYITGLDYPKDRLDVKILLEPDDTETLDAIRATGLPDFCEVIICPDSRPRTKPKACNHGLARARGELTVIYDAEDRPEPDQLKKAVIAFRRADARWKRFRLLRMLNPFRRAAGGRTACLQAKLNYYNPDQNLLTRWFAIEYATWFQLFLPGLHALRAPIPLGGTSNHFRTDVLQQVGGWDPFNVTEDCDLGIRLHKLGHRTQVLDTTTWEEANSRLGNWIRQRSRWVKGYLQTHFTHMRHPLSTLWRLGPLGTFHFLNSVGGLSLMLLLNPLFWASSLLYLGLFTTDLSEHGWSFKEAVGVEQAIRDAGDLEVRRDQTIRVPHPDRWAWPMVCTVRCMDIAEDASWSHVLWRGMQRDWAYLWVDRPTLGSGGATDAILEEPPAGGEDDDGIIIVSEEEMGAEPETQIDILAEPVAAPEQAPGGASGGFHFWNAVSQALFLCTVGLVLGNFFFVAIHVIACLRAGVPRMIPYALLTPFYWVLISLAAWKGFFQLFWKPFYWEKTQHGLDAKGAAF